MPVVRLTDEVLAEIEKRAEAATPGPWTALPYPGEDDRCDGIVAGSGVEYIVQTDSGVYGPMMPDATFIAAARSDVPALLAEIDALKAERGTSYAAGMNRARQIVRENVARFLDELAGEKVAFDPAERERADAAHAAQLASEFQAAERDHEFGEDTDGDPEPDGG